VTSDGDQIDSSLILELREDELKARSKENLWMSDRGIERKSTQ
jgi:hypothetical protein